MSKFRITIIALFFSATGLIVSCSSETSESTDTTKDSVKVENTEKSENVTEETTTEEVNKTDEVAKYVCPARCEEGKSATPGVCPSCGMELIENPEK